MRRLRAYCQKIYELLDAHGCIPDYMSKPVSHINAIGILVLIVTSYIGAVAKLLVKGGP